MSDHSPHAMESAQPAPAQADAPTAGRWYCVNRNGMATLCTDDRDALANAVNADKMYPRYAPHIAAQLVPVVQADALDAARVPLTYTQVMELGLSLGYDGDNPDAKAHFINGIRHAERMHGITGGASLAPEGQR
jgi:hypothetical protein